METTLESLLDALEDVANGDGLACWQDVEEFADDTAWELLFDLEVP